MKPKSIVVLISVLVLLFLIYISTVVKVYAYINDSIIIMIVAIALYFMYEKLNLNPLTYSLIIFALILHDLGVFGFYNISPLPIQWDHITHFFSNFSLTFISFNYLKKYFSKNKFDNTWLIIFIVLISLGVGAIGELIEFTGYLTVGEGAGVLGHGKGDIVTELGNSEWLNTMLDLIFNLIGTLTSLVTISIYYKLKNS